MNTTAPSSLSTLAERYDPKAFELRRDSARVRLAGAGPEPLDAVLDGRGATLVATDTSQRPDALLSADEPTWASIADDVRGFSVAPLLLVTFVENAFKYVSSYDNRTNEVMISLGRKGDALHFRAYNTKEEEMVQLQLESGGIGVANARRRLDLQYPGKHELVIADNGDSYEVLLRLNIVTNVTQSHYSR